MESAKQAAIKVGEAVQSGVAQATKAGTDVGHNIQERAEKLGHHAQETQHKAAHELSSAEKGPTTTPGDKLHQAKNHATNVLTK